MMDPPYPLIKLEQSIDILSVFLDSLQSIQNSIDFCYPGKTLEEDRCHGQLQAIQAQVTAMTSVIANIKRS